MRLKARLDRIRRRVQATQLEGHLARVVIYDPARPAREALPEDELAGCTVLLPDNGRDGTP